MEYRSNKEEVSKSREDADGKFDLDALLHPAKAFAHPMDVVRDPDLTLAEKRALLASWASDACAVEAVPELRSIASGTFVRWDGIMDALRALDEECGHYKPLPHYKRVLAKKDIGLLGARPRLHRADDQGHALG
jgi:hypothetical protein